MEGDEGGASAPDVPPWGTPAEPWAPPPVSPAWGTAPGTPPDGSVPAWGTPPSRPGRAQRVAAFARSRAVLGWTAAAAATVVLVVVGVNAGNSAEGHPGAAEPVAAGAAADGGVSTYLEDLKPGDCVDAPADGADVDALPVVACGVPHTEEVIGTATLPAGPWTSDDAVGDAAADACTPLFTRYLGISPDDSSHDLTTYDPTEEGWAAGNRSVTCVVETSRAQTASLRGAKN